MSADLTHPHDRFFRRIWSRKGIARDFLAHYLPREVVERLALDTLEFSSVISLRHVIEQSYPWPVPKPAENRQPNAVM